MAASPMLLLTRPQRASEKLATQLAALGYQSQIAPVLDIQPLDTPFPNTTPVDAVMLTSSHALLTLGDRVEEIEQLKTLPCYCVGATTAETARAAGFRNVRASDSDGTALAKIVGNEIANNARILHVTARDVSSAALEQLNAQGVHVIEWPVYQANAIVDLAPATIAALQNGQISAVLVFSTRSASALVKLMARYGLSPCCQRLGAIGISEAVLSPLRSLPWQCIVAATTPNEKAVIARVQALYPIAELS